MDDFYDPELPGRAAKRELVSAPWLGFEYVAGEIDCEETVKVLAADSVLAPLTMENTAGELSAVEAVE